MARDFAKAFYKSEEWQNVREGALMRDKYLCQECGAPAEEVHHIIHLTPQNINNPEITLKLSNLKCLCKECHFKIHTQDKVHGIREKHGMSDGDCDNGFHFDEFGFLVPDPCTNPPQ